MTRFHHTALSAVYCLLLVLILSGCQATAPTQQPRRTATSQPGSTAPAADQSQALDAAMQAMDALDYPRAISLFQQQLKEQEELPEAAYYDYGLALSRTGNYAAAIKYLTLYIDNLGRHGNNFFPALEERNRAEENRTRQSEHDARSAAADKTFSRIRDALDTNWQQVQALTATRPASFSEPLTGMEMLLVKGGCFQMGDLFGVGEEDERPVHEVCVADFYLGKYEVTQGQWTKVMGYNPSGSAQGESFPVDKVSWNQAVEFSKKLGGSQGRYRLPTEAEWEFAARSGGRKQKFSGSGPLDQLAWHEDNSNGQSHQVGRKQPNGLGLHDMSGNVYEWCFDDYADDDYRQSSKQNPTGPVSGSTRVRRGGSWNSETAYNRTSDRTDGDPDEYRSVDTGFRLTLPVSPPVAPATLPAETVAPTTPAAQ